MTDIREDRILQMTDIREDGISQMTDICGDRILQMTDIRAVSVLFYLVEAGPSTCLIHFHVLVTLRKI